MAPKILNPHFIGKTLMLGLLRQSVWWQDWHATLELRRRETFWFGESWNRPPLLGKEITYHTRVGIEREKKLYNAKFFKNRIEDHRITLQKKTGCAPFRWEKRFLWCFVLFGAVFFAPFKKTELKCLAKKSTSILGSFTFWPRCLGDRSDVRKRIWPSDPPKYSHHKQTTSWWLNQPIWKIYAPVKLDHLNTQTFGVKIQKKCLKLPPTRRWSLSRVSVYIRPIKHPYLWGIC